MTTYPSCSRETTQILPRIVVPLLLIASVLMALRSIVHSRTIFDGSIHNSYNPKDNYNDNREATAARASFLDYSPKFQRTKYTFDSFVIGEDGDKIDLAQFGLEPDEGNNGNSNKNIIINKQHPSTVTLFRDFDLRNRLSGNETWIELLEYRRDDTRPSLSFYVDKVAFKRWLHSSSHAHNDAGLGGIESIESFLLKYKTELVALQRDVNANDNINTNDSDNDNTPLLSSKIKQWLPVDEDYAAKPTHLSCSGGVWLVHNDPKENTTYVGNGKKKMTKFRSSTNNDKDNDSNAVDVRTTIADDLASNLQKVQEKCGRTVLESYALRHVRPGIVVEERFTQPSTIVGDTNSDTNNNNDNVDSNYNAAGDESFFKGGMEFKVFTIWGRAWLTVWRPGTDGVKALLFRNGTNLVFDPPPAKKKHKKDNTKDKYNKKDEEKKVKPPSIQQQLPEWIDWDRVISIGERLGRNKDMFRTDIFVGVGTAGRRKQQKGDNDNINKTIRYVVSETEIHPTPLRGFEQVFEEAGRLWLAGYYLLSRQNRLSVISNTEVPQEFYGASTSNTN